MTKTVIRNTPTSSGTTSLFEASFAKIPPRAKRVYIRADKGFSDHHIIEKIEEHTAVLFTIAVANFYRRVRNPIGERNKIITKPFYSLLN